MAEVPLVLIDANIYLEFYASEKIASLIEPLMDLRKFVLRTEQLWSEVQRNKLRKVVEFMNRTIKLPDKLGAPFHLLPKGDETDSLRKRILAFDREREELAGAVQKSFGKLFEEVYESKDPISVQLAAFFEKPKKASDAELAKARRRKELGQAPGKHADPIGDELTWEQLLTDAPKHDRYWIFTRDSDYCVEFQGQYRLHPCLFEELSDRSGRPIEVHCHNSLSQGISSLAECAEVQPGGLPSKETLAEIDKEEQTVDMGSRLAQYVVMYGLTRNVLRNSGLACSVCGTTEGVELKHIVPFARAGSWDPSNIQLVCDHCRTSGSTREE